MLHRFLLVAAAAAAASPALAAEPDTLPEGSPLINGVTACQAIADPQQRLACFDASVARLKTATEERDVVVLDKEQVRKTRRSLFGFSLPDLPKIFGGGDGDDKDEPEFTQLESEIIKARAIMPGKWLMVLPDGAAWQYAEINRRFEPRPGDKILIKRASLGSYMANIDGNNAVRVERIR